MLTNNKKPRLEVRVFIKVGADLLLQDLVLLPSALAGLTTLFGMGRGDPRRSKHHYFCSLLINLFSFDVNFLGIFILVIDILE